MVAEDNKQRYAFNKDKIKIRANQRHSIKVDLGFKSQKPPEILHHGTAARFLESIRLTGLQSQNRQHVHFLKDLETAKKVG